MAFWLAYKLAIGKAIPPLGVSEMLVKFATLAGGVFIEQRDEAEYSAMTRCFRFDEKGNAEFAYYGDLTSSNPAPRWYGHAFKERDFVFA